MAPLELHPSRNGKQFTLRGLFHDRSDANAKQAALADEGFETHAYDEQAPSGDKLTHVAARREVQRVARAGIPHDHSTPWEAVRVAMDRFRRVERAAGDLTWYKPLELRRLKGTIESWDWQGSVEEVAADILTKTIRAHPFPNANHRTSLYLARIYLEAVGIDWPSYSLRGKGKDRYHDDVSPFILTSKYLLQLLRHRTLVEIAVDEGYTHLDLGRETTRIEPADLNASDAQLKNKHQRGAQRLVRRLASDGDASNLAQSNSIGLSEWVKEGQR